jgi:hypothetical protein
MTMRDGGTHFALTSPRFVVTELEGFLQVGGDRRRARHAKPGASFAVIDTLWNHRRVGNFRSEDYRHAPQSSTIEQARHEANRLCHLLNGEIVPPPLLPPRQGFKPTCPREECAHRCDPDALYCPECGTRLYTYESGRYGEKP